MHGPVGTQNGCTGPIGEAGGRARVELRPQDEGSGTAHAVPGTVDVEWEPSRPAGEIAGSTAHGHEPSGPGAGRKMWARQGPERTSGQGATMDDAPQFSESAPIKVFLLDDHEVVRRGLRDLLDTEPDIVVVGEAGTADHALARGPALRPDVAVLDVRLPDGDGITVCRELRSRMPGLACLMLTSFDDDDALLDAIMAGAAGYVLKQIKGSDLVSAVRAVASGQSMLDPATTTRLMRTLRHDDTPACAADDALSGLSPASARSWT